MTTAAIESMEHILGGKTEQKLLVSFFVLYKTARLVDEKNATFRNQVSELFNQIKAFSENTGQVTIKCVGGRYFIDEKMVRFDDRGISGAAGVINEWQRLGIGGITFLSGTNLDDLCKLMRFLASVKPRDHNIEELVEDLKKQDFPRAKLLSIQEVRNETFELTETIRKRFRNMARVTFFRAMDVVKEVIVRAEEDREIDSAKTRRVVHTLIDHIMRDESSLLELAAIKDFDDYTYAHSMNVCVYALTVGVRLGLDRPRLSQLGFSAMFHDIGKVKLPKDLITKPDAFDENDWIQMQRHPLLGAKTILRNLQLDVHTARAARVAFEHHINNDFTGYPTLRHEQRTPELFSRIISIVDSFDALVSGRVYIKKSISPDEVIKKMRYQMAVKFDPFLLKIFNDIIGVYPAGSLVLLTTEEIALVLTNNDDDRARPYIKIVGNRDGLLSEPIWVDLSQPDEKERKIVRMIEPERYGLDIKDFVLRD